MATLLPPLRPATQRATLFDLWRAILGEVVPRGKPTAKLEVESNFADATSARALATELSGDRDFRALVQFLKREDPDGTWFLGANRARDVGVDGDALGCALMLLAGEWKGSGARRRTVGVALHLSTAELFGVSAEAFVGAVPRDVLDAAGRVLTSHRGALRRFIELQYERTQRFIGGPIAAFRGAVVAEPQGCRDLCELDPRLWPLSSFSLDGHVGESFPMPPTPLPALHERYVVLMAEVPPERVLATSVTGFASLFEQEVVVVGGDDDRVSCFVGNDDKRLTLGSTDAYWAALTG